MIHRCVRRLISVAGVMIVIMDVMAIVVAGWRQSDIANTTPTICDKARLTW